MLGAEGVAAAVAAVALYLHADYPWWVLAALALVPDVSMAGYLAGPRRRRLLSTAGVGFEPANESPR
jgi:uncharacterized protein DUF4260